MKQLLSIAIILITFNFSFSQTTDNTKFEADLIKIQAKPCPVEGQGRNLKEQELNREKNRSCVISADAKIDTVSIDEILKPGYDLNRFSIKQIITVRGYVILAISGGPESCNCKATDKADQDTHLMLAKNPTDGTKEAIKEAREKAFVVEVTPVYPNRAQVDWRSFVGEEVEVTGYVFYDIEHVQNAVNTNPKGTNLWRASVMEIHPLINIVKVKK